MAGWMKAATANSLPTIRPTTAMVRRSREKCMTGASLTGRYAADGAKVPECGSAWDRASARYDLEVGDVVRSAGAAGPGTSQDEFTDHDLLLK